MGLGVPTAGVNESFEDHDTLIMLLSVEGTPWPLTVGGEVGICKESRKSPCWESLRGIEVGTRHEAGIRNVGTRQKENVSRLEQRELQEGRVKQSEEVTYRANLHALTEGQPCACSS